MGNRCCRHEQKKELDPSTSSLHIIREAQRKYFNSHIESGLDDSDEDDDDERDDSTDGGLYGSESSLITCEDNSLDYDATDGPIIPETEYVLQTSVNAIETEVSSSAIEMGTDNNNCNKEFLENGTTSLRQVSTTGEGENSSKPVKTKSSKVVMRKRPKPKYIQLRKSNFYSILNTEDKKARSVDPKQYQYPFENIVFEGGGNKGLAYCGAVKLLEELNIWPQIKRLAGTSAGAMTAALLAVGYESHDLEQFFSLNLNNIFLDHKFGYLSLLPNLLTSYGWNPGNRIYKWFGQKLFERTGDMDITFRQVYERYQRELCLVVTNLNQMTSLYCHPKTTPDLSVRLAVRMSMSIPGMFEAVKHTLHGQTDIFVDGGVLCNYPIHCFDGWWLSMKPEDNFLEKLQPLEDIPRLLERTERFGTYNEKTLGMQLYSDNEQDLLKYQLENLRHGVQLQELPNTKLAREKIRKKKLQTKTDREHRRLVKAMNAFLRALSKHNMDRNDNIDREELEAALNDEIAFPRHRKLILFGDVGSDVILDYLDKDHNGQVSYNELLSFMEETGISMQNRFLGYQRRVINSFPSFLDTLQSTLLTNVKRVYVEERDLKRTVGINTGHVGTSDFVLEPADVDFVLERGRRSLEAFLKYYVASNHLKKKAEYRRFSTDIRKNSKCSVISSSSNQSLDSGINALFVPGVTVPSFATSPLAARVKVEVKNDSFVPLNPDHGAQCHTKSPGKCVSINPTIMFVDEAGQCKTRYEKREAEEDGDIENANSECIFLLGDESEYNAEINREKPYSVDINSLSKHPNTLPTSSAAGAQVNGLDSPLLNFVPNVKILTKDSVTQKEILKSNVHIVKSKGPYDSATTPLLQPVESQDAMELHALRFPSIYRRVGQPTARIRPRAHVVWPAKEAMMSTLSDFHWHRNRAIIGRPAAAKLNPFTKINTKIYYI